MAQTVLKKDKTVNVKTKTGGSYSYSYSTLAEIHRYLEETGQKYEAFIQKVEGEDYMFIRKLGEKETTLQGAKIPSVSGVQDYGGVLTSVRRFSLLMAYGLACEDEPVNKPVENSVDKWKTMHKASPNRPASDKQKAAIRTLAERLDKDTFEIMDLIKMADNAEKASKIIEDLGKEVKKKDADN